MRPSDGPARFAMIMGAMKCGTTTLFDLLSQHPEICPSRIKEPDFFTHDSGPIDINKYLSLWDWKPAAHRVAVEASVSYTKLPFFPGVASRVHSSELGDVRFIYLMRHPLKRIESQARHALYAGWGKSFDEQIDPDLIAYSRYAMQLDEYRAVFGRECLLPLFLDDLEQKPEETLRVVCEFLGVDASYKFKDPDKRSNTGDLYSAWPVLAAVSKSSLGRSVLRRGIPAPVKAYIRTAVARFRPPAGESTALGGRWKLSATEREAIWQELRSEMRRLELDYGLTLPATWHGQSD